jgi:hypothetical protein
MVKLWKIYETCVENGWNMYSMKIYGNAIIQVFPLIQQNTLKLRNLTWIAYVRGRTLPDESTMEVTHQKM